ncbi:glutamate--tRNA ligase [bacterium BMS3Abin04]|nr:glutamate--tRNA ligase [bacterium BMS3Abin04]
MINFSPRVRFAPSPTGYLHIGGLRTALFNYLFAKHNNGKIVLRIEDTDRNRFVEGAVENLIEILDWSGIYFDEGPTQGGDYGPYFQSKRLELYHSYTKKLLDDKKAYRCFCSPERLKELRESQQKQKLPQIKYDKHCLNLSEDEIQNKLNNNERYVIRLNVQPGELVHVNDIVRGRVEFNTDNIDDQILIKSDGYPTYHLANVVDDHLMKITHVIRGEEWLSSTPKHILLYDYLEWEHPVFAHLPLLLNTDKSKLSKRQGDVAVEDYRDKGYLKETLINFVALLGWNAGDDQEYYDMEELIKKFTLERVNKSGAVFNIEKLNWLNGEHIRKKTIDDLLPELKKLLRSSKYEELSLTDEYLRLVLTAMHERITFVKDIITNSWYFFERPTQYDEKTIKKRWKNDSESLLKQFLDSVEGLENPTKEDFETVLKKVTENNNVGLGRLIHPLRLALSGVGYGPGIFDLIYILGKEEVVERIKKGLDILPKLKNDIQN